MVFFRIRISYPFMCESILKLETSGWYHRITNSVCSYPMVLTPFPQFSDSLPQIDWGEYKYNSTIERTNMNIISRKIRASLISSNEIRTSSSSFFLTSAIVLFVISALVCNTSGSKSIALSTSSDAWPTRISAWRLSSTASFSWAQDCYVTTKSTKIFKMTT